MKFDPTAVTRSVARAHSLSTQAQELRRPASEEDPQEDQRRRNRFLNADRGVERTAQQGPFAYNAAPVSPPPRAPVAAVPETRPLAAAPAAASAAAPAPRVADPKPGPAAIDTRVRPDKRLISFAPDDVPALDEVRARLQRRGILTASQSDAVRVAIRIAAGLPEEKLVEEYARLTRMKAGR